MQIDKKYYNPEAHELHRALSVKQPYASDLITPAYKEADGTTRGVKSIEVSSRNTSYRGDIVICSSAAPILPDLPSGVTLGKVELYGVKPIAEFTEADWNATRIPIEKRKEIKKGYGWLMRNPRPCVEFPVKGQLGIFTLCCFKDEIIEYPQIVKYDKKAWEMMQSNLTEKAK